MIEQVCVSTHRFEPERPRRAVDGLHLCVGCLEHLRRLVAEAPAVWDDLALALRRDAQATVKRSGGDTGLYVSPAVTAARDMLHGAVCSWARVVCEDRGLNPPRSDDIHTVAAWLIRHVDWCASHRWVDEMRDELRSRTGRARALMDGGRTKRIPIGERCRRVTGDEQCDGTITMLIDADELWSALCDVCGTDQDPVPYIRGVRRARLVTEEGVVLWCRYSGHHHITGQTVRKWASRGRIRRHESDGRVLFDLAEVQDYLSGRRMAS